MSEAQSFILANDAPGMGRYGPEDDSLHPEQNAAVAHHALSETQYFGFNVPEHDIDAFGYFWHHPRLGIVTGGAMVWQGKKGWQTSAELFDVRAFMPDDVVANGLSAYELENSYAVEIIEPLRKMRIRYRDDARGNAFDVGFDAVAPPAMRSSGRHFEQVLRTRGALTLRGKDYEVDGYNIRDRSWAEARPEVPVASPPIAWSTGVFGDDFAFNCACSEDPSGRVSWRHLYPDADLAHALRGGWVLLGGVTQPIVSARSLVTRDPVYLQPMAIDLDVETADGAHYAIRGEVTASLTMSVWPNAVAPICLTRWTCGGRVGWGDIQEIQWTDFAWGHSPPRD